MRIDDVDADVVDEGRVISIWIVERAEAAKLQLIFFGGREGDGLRCYVREIARVGRRANEEIGSVE